jgi:hypothetical protein
MKIPESILRLIPPALATATVALYSVVFAHIYQQVGKPFPERLYSSLLSELQRGSVQLLLLSLAVLATWVVYLHIQISRDPQIIRGRYAFDPKTRIRTRRGVRYCHKCLMSPECFEAPLTAGNVQGVWVCETQNCGGVYRDSTFIQPPPESQQPRGHW